MKKEQAELIMNNILKYLQDVNAKNTDILNAYSMQKGIKLVIDLEKSNSKGDLAIAIRDMVSAEYDAIKKYTKILETTEDDEAKKTISSIINEERVHAGEFLTLLKQLFPEEARLYGRGEKEVSGNKSISLLVDLEKSDYTRVRNGKLEFVHDKRVKHDKKSDSDSKLQKVISDFVDKSVHLNYETGLTVTPQGDTVLEKSGEASQIKFEPEEILKMKDNIFMHNHPRGSSFSIEDVIFLIRNGLKEIKAIGAKVSFINSSNEVEVHQNIYNMKTINPMTKDDLVNFVDNYNQVNETIRTEYENAISEGKLVLDQANYLHGDTLWRVMSELIPNLQYSKQVIIDKRIKQ